MEKDFKILSKISEGSFAKVFLAKDKNQNLVALKKLISTSSPARIEREIHFLKLLNGESYIVKFNNAFRSKDEVTIVLEYFEHDEFRDYFIKMTEIDLKQYLRAILTALSNLHANGVVHRDVKPSNFLHKYGTDKFCLVDFGLSQKVEDLENFIKTPSKRAKETIGPYKHSSSPQSVNTSFSQFSAKSSGYMSPVRAKNKQDVLYNKTKSIPFHTIQKELKKQIDQPNHLITKVFF